MIVTSVVLLMFIILVVWHDRPHPLKNQQELKNQLLQKNPAFENFLSQVKVADESIAFYSVGLQKEQSWPCDLSRACYPDPLAAHWQFAAIGDSYSTKIEVIRYRSLNDFLELLVASEHKNPGYILSLNFNTHTLAAENPLAVSLRSLIAILSGVLGLLVVRRVQREP